MALYTTMGAKNIPEGGVRLSKSEALEFQKRIIKKWKSLPDIFFLEYGWFVSSAYTFTSSMIVTNMSRSLLNIGSHSRFLPFLLTSGTPALLSGLWTEKVVTESSLLMSASCPLCLHLKFGICQTVIGVIYPTIISMALYLPIAHRYNTYPVPDISSDARGIFQLSFKLLKSKALQFKILAALQIPLVLLLPYLQKKELDKINQILMKENDAKTEFNFQE